MLEMEGEDLCVLCSSSTSTSHYSEASVEESSLLKSLILKLDGPSPTLRKQELLLCSGCTSLVSSAIKRKAEVIAVEEKVEGLKRELGAELVKLRGQLVDLKMQMKKIEKVKCQMEKSMDPGGTELKDFSHEEVENGGERIRFRNSIIQVVRHLQEEYDLITRKTGNFFPIFQISIEDYKQNSSSGDSDMEKEGNDVVVGDVKQVEPVSDDEFDKHLPSSDESTDNRGTPRKIKDEPMEEEEDEENPLDPDWMEDSGAVSSSGEEEDDEDKAHIPENIEPKTSTSKLPMSKSTTAAKPTGDGQDPKNFIKGYQNFLDEIKGLGLGKFTSTPFKQHVIGRILLKDKKLDSSNTNTNDAKADDFDKVLQNIDKNYKIEYKLDQDFLHVNGIEMKINDDKKSLCCSLCDFQTSGDRRNCSITVEYILYDHIIGEHLSVFKCPRCPEPTNSRRTFLQHAYLHRRKQRDREALNICDICKKPIKNRTYFKMHKWTHKSEQEKNEARLIQQNTRKYDPDPWIPFNCPTCKQDFPSSKRLKYHIESHHKPPDLEEILCPICGKSFPPLPFQNHQRTCGEELKPRPSRAKKYKCHLCEKVYSSSSFLKDHLNSAAHYDLKKFQCHICPKTFTAKAKLNFHVAGHAQPGRECSKKCGKKFKRNQCLKLHEAKCNGPIGTPPAKPLLSCEICSKIFKYPWKLKRHVNSVHVPKPPKEPFLCSHCPKLFKLKSLLTEHLKKIEKSAAGVRDHLCRKGCGAGFVFPKTRWKHEKACNGSGTSHGKRPTYVVPRAGASSSSATAAEVSNDNI